VPLTFQPEGPSPAFGPGFGFVVQPNIASPQNLPWTWRVDFHYGVGFETLLYTILRPDTVGQGQRFTILWNEDGTPSQIAAPLTIAENADVRMTTTVVDDTGQQVQPPLVVPAPWSTTVNQHIDLFRFQKNLLEQLQGGSSSSQLDRIEAAVYQRFPNG